jgi:hypothetical protein
MTSLDVARRRLFNQHLCYTKFTKPTDLVKWMGAVQAQDYYGAKWALGQRLLAATDDAIEKAFADGRILRTHVMRPTWHFVARADIRWMLRLTAPRVKAFLSHYHRKLELDESVLKAGNKVLANALKGRKHHTRDVLRKALERAGIPTNGERLIHILAHAELDEVICSGPRQGKLFTYALLDERAPKTESVTREDSLAMLTRRYFKSHGPATISDFVWWSGLTTTDARNGIDMVQRSFVREVVEGKGYWLSPSAPSGLNTSPVVNLIPTYDEYLVAYKDRSAALPHTGDGPIKENLIFGSTIVIDGRVVGVWKRAVRQDEVAITLTLFRPLTRIEKQGVEIAANEYGKFLGLRAKVV